VTKDYTLEMSYKKSLEINQIAFIFFFFIINIFIMITNRTGDISITLSFFTNLLFIMVFSSLHIFSKKISLFDSVFLVFFYTFFGWLLFYKQKKECIEIPCQ